MALKYGDYALVRNSNTHKYQKRIYLTTINEKCYHPYVCVTEGYEKAFLEGKSFDTTLWSYIYNYVELHNLPDYKLNQPLIVSDSSLKKYKRHFYKWDELTGFPICFSKGQTSFSYDGGVEFHEWTHFRLPVDSELNGFYFFKDGFYDK